VYETSNRAQNPNFLIAGRDDWLIDSSVKAIEIVAGRSLGRLRVLRAHAETPGAQARGSM